MSDENNRQPICVKKNAAASRTVKAAVKEFMGGLACSQAVLSAGGGDTEFANAKRFTVGTWKTAQTIFFILPLKHGSVGLQRAEDKPVHIGRVDPVTVIL